MEYNLVDSFLPYKEFITIRDTMLSADFPWYYNETVLNLAVLSPDEKRHFQFTHSFYGNDAPQSSFFPLLEPLLEKIKPKALIKVKANLGVATNKIEEQGWHTDYSFECKTAVYYLNDNDGFTLFADGTKIQSSGNRFVEFNSQLKHSGTTHTNTKVRAVINLNYF